MAFKQLVEKRNELEAKTKKLADIFAEAKTDNAQVKDFDKIKSLEGTTSEKLAAIRKMNEELEALGKEVDDLAALEAAEKNLAASHGVKGGEDAPRFSGNGDGEEDGPKGLGDLFVQSDLYKQLKSGAMTQVKGEIKGGGDMLLKTTFSTSAGWAPESLRIGRMIPEALRPIQVLDTIPGGRTGQAVVKYMEETTVTNSAAARNEAAAYAESALALTEQSSTVRSIGTSLPVTDEQLEDVAEVSSYLNMRLPFLVRQKLDGYCLTGTGVAPIPAGFNNVTGIQTQALGGDNVPDAVYKAMVKIRVTGRAMPNVVYIHPTDWQGVRLLRTNDGLYIWGNPSEAGPMRIWGVSVVETDAQTLGTGLVGDTANFSQLFTRRDLIVEVGYDSDDFSKGLRTFRCGMRVALVTYRPAAFCTVTGL